MNEKIFNLNVSGEYNGSRVDKFLQSKLNTISRTKLQNLIRNGLVKVNKSVIYETSKKIKTKDTIEVNFPPPKTTSIKPRQT